MTLARRCVRVKRVLKPGGVIIVMDVMSPGHPVRDVWLQTVEALRGHLTCA
ncbi:SAM-dependent methyltransferase [Klebsiella pneumoniae subsp. rhinoscleromatis]|nr:SAM-dependent methyltransferase [Klebsiella pneumoniae subsp. rhinoscleromatis]